MPKLLLDKIKTFSELFKIPKSEVDRLGFFDITPAIDSPLYIDSKLLTDNVCPGFIGAATQLRNRFSNLVDLISRIKEETKADVFWRAVDKKLSFTEIQGTCLGYSTDSTEGKGIGKKTRKIIISNIRQLLSSGYIEPELMNLLCVFTEGFGCDMASDLITFLIKEVIFDYNTFLINEMSLQDHKMVYYMDRVLLENPCRPGTPLILLPKCILSDLPVCYSFEDIENASFLNEMARQDLQTYIDTNGVSKKKAVFDYLVNNKEALNDLIKAYLNATGNIYDYEKDPLCVIRFKEIVKGFIENNYGDIIFEDGNVPSDLKNVAERCIGIFKHLIEDCGGRNQIHQFDEKGIQLLFFATSYAICQINNVAISPEVNYGSGPVDFFLTQGRSGISIEIKKSTNSGYKRGLKKQIPQYIMYNE